MFLFSSQPKLAKIKEKIFTTINLYFLFYAKCETNACIYYFDHMCISKASKGIAIIGIEQDP